mgnify:FL=1
MKKLKLSILTLLTVFATSSIFVSCSNEDDNKNQEEIANTYNYLTYLSETQELKAVAVEAVNDYKKTSNQSSKNEDIQTYTINYIKDNYADNIGLMNDEFINNIFSEKLNKSDAEITLEDTGLPQIAISYFNQLESLNSNQDYIGIVNLLHQFKLEDVNNPDLESLAGVFSVIETYENDFLTSNNKAECAPSGAVVGGAAISGAISGAIWGVKLGSWLGPAGTVAGAVGGAVAGAVISSIVSVVVQGVACES